MPNLSPIQSDNKIVLNRIEPTLIYYLAQKSPSLSIFEKYKYLNNFEFVVKNLSLSDFYDSSNNDRRVGSKNGFYWLSSENKNQYEKRILAAKISTEKIKKAKKASRFLKLIPFIKSIAITGSVSMNSAAPESDIDLFIISQENRIWLTRILTVFITHLSGRRRYKNKIQNRICLNLYIAGENTIFPIQNIASAHMIARALPIYGKDIFVLFLSANKNWLGEYIENFDKNFLISGGIPSNYKLQTINCKLADFLEKIIGKILSKRMIRNTPTAKPPHLIINNNALVFYYPHSKNQEVLEKYHRAIAFYQSKI